MKFSLSLKFLNLLIPGISLSASDNSSIWIPTCLFLLPLNSAFILVLFSLMPNYFKVNTGHCILKIIESGLYYLLLERIYFYFIYAGRPQALSIPNQFDLLEIKMIQRGSSILLGAVLSPFRPLFLQHSPAQGPLQW